MSDIGDKLERMIPKSINDIIRLNRDEASLRVLGDLDIYNLARIESVASVKARAKSHEIENWYIVQLHIVPINQDITFMVGYRRGEVFNTSGVVAIDVEAGVVRTQNSVYLLGDRGVGELDGADDINLRLHVCAYLHTCSFAGKSLGHILGVLDVFY